MPERREPAGVDPNSEPIGAGDGELQPLAPELDPLIHEPARLRIMVTLAALNRGDSIWFVRLQEITGLTPGNLTTHLRRLEDGGYVASLRGPADGKASRTYVELTTLGREALKSYKLALRSLLSLSEEPELKGAAQDVRGSDAVRAIREQGRARPRTVLPGLSGGAI